MYQILAKMTLEKKTKHQYIDLEHIHYRPSIHK